jgi:High potential iron-sulfur protein
VIIVRARARTINDYFWQIVREKRENAFQLSPSHRITTMQRKISRRAIVKSGLIAGTFIPAIGLIANSAVAAGLPPLDPKDPTAQALGFVTDASKVDATANPTFKPTQKCSTCAQYQGKATDATAGCNIFAGKSVPAGGWCKVWAAKPA